MRPSLAAAALLALLVPGAARANSARPVGYGFEVEGTTVTVQPDVRGCGEGEAMLRQDAATGATVRLAEFCGAAPLVWAPEGAGMPYVDECVSPGTYRYGFERAYPCYGAATTSRWDEVTVTAPVAGCTRSPANAGPTATDPVLWGMGFGDHPDRYVCTYDGPPGAFGCTTAGASGVVLLLDAAALTLGWALLRRRRRA